MKKIKEFLIKIKEIFNPLDLAITIAFIIATPSIINTVVYVLYVIAVLTGIFVRTI